MNLSELQAELRHFAAERDWQPFHTPKNLATALLVEAAELAEIFQWMTPEESVQARQDAAARQRIGEELADVLLYLLQAADHCEIDLPQAVRAKLAHNATRFPPKRHIARVSPQRSTVPGTHVLLDYENVQPSEAELRALVPEASQVWVFHGPHKRQVEERFAGFGNAVTAVPISKTGKNALDFHLSFYMGYIASRNQATSMVVVANDKGYEPMLVHAREMGFAVRQQGHGPARKAAARRSVAAAKPVKATTPRKAAARKAAAKPAPAPAPAVPAKRAAVKKAPVQRKPALAKPVNVQPAAAEQPALPPAPLKTDLAPAKTTSKQPARRGGARQQPVKDVVTKAPVDTPAAPAAKKRADKAAPAPVPAPAKPAAAQPASEAAAAPAPQKPAAKSSAAMPKRPAQVQKPVQKRAEKPAEEPLPKPAQSPAPRPPHLAAAAADPVRKLTDGLLKLGTKRPSKPAALRRWLKSALGASATDAAVDVALASLSSAGVVRIDAARGATYPLFGG